MHHPEYGCIEGKFAVFLRIDGEFDVMINAIDVFCELFHVIFMKNGECVSHVM